MLSDAPGPICFQVVGAPSLRQKNVKWRWNENAEGIRQSGNVKLARSFLQAKPTRAR